MTTIAIAGCGHIHTPGFINMLSRRADVRVKSVWDHHAVRGRTRAEQLKAELVMDVATIAADPQITAVAICSETDRHAAIVSELAVARKHLFVEKPLGIAAADAYRMADAIEKAGVIFQTGYFQRGNGQIRKIKELVDAGTLGTITRVRASNCHGGSLGGWFDSKPADPANDWRWMADLKQSGVGAFGDLGTHSLDLLLWIMGPVKVVTASLDPVTRRYDGCDETGEALMVFANGAIGTLAAAWVDVANPVYFLVSGTRGHAAIVGDKLLATIPDAKIDGPIAETPAAWPHAFELWLDAVAGKRDVPLVGPREAAYRSAVMEAMYVAAKARTWETPARG